MLYEIIAFFCLFSYQLMLNLILSLNVAFTVPTVFIRPSAVLWEKRQRVSIDWEINCVQSALGAQKMIVCAAIYKLQLKSAFRSLISH